MAALVIAEHDNARLKRRHAQHRHRGAASAAATCTCWSPAHNAGARGAGRRADRRRGQGAARRRRHLAEQPGRERRRAGAGDRRRTTATSCSRPPRTARTSPRAWPPARRRRRSPTSPRSISADTFERPIYAGNAIATVQSGDADQGDHRAHHRLRRRGGHAAAAPRSRPSPRVADSGMSSFVGSEIAKNDRPELTAAKIIVSGGRAHGHRARSSTRC